MRIIFIYHWNEGPQSGVQRKVRLQTRAWTEAGHEVRQLIVCRRELVDTVRAEGQDAFGYGSGLDRLRVWDRVAREVLAWTPDVVYHRFDLFAPGLWRLARRVPMVLEINTDDVVEYALQGGGRALFNRWTRGLLLGAAVGHVYVTHELARSPHFKRFGRPGVVLANGSNLAATPLMPPAPTSGPPSLVFMGTPGQPWQGVDKLVALAHAWPEAQFDVVGSSSQDLPGEVPDNLMLHGYLDPTAYRLVLQRATVALGSLALHRKGMQEASPLKVREYLGAGLPVALAYQDTDFPQGAPFLLPLPNEEENLVPQLARLQTFVRDWRGRRVEREAVRVLDSSSKEQARLAFMTELVQQWASTKKQGNAVLLLTTGLNYGGAEVQVVNLACGLRARGWQVDVVSLVTPRAFTQELAQAGVGVHSLGMDPSRPTWQAVWRWRSTLRSLRPDVMHSHMVHANLLGRLGRLLARVPVQISTAHNIDEGGGWRNHAYALTDRLATLTTNVSNAATTRYVRDGLTPAGRIRTVPNGVDTLRFAPNVELRAAVRAELGLEDAFVWLCVGRFALAKDHATLLRAFGPLAQADARAALLLIGEGELKEEAVHLARVYGIERQVHFLGQRNDVAAFLNAADAYVMSSAWEGLPMVLLEAGASGLPIVATEVGGNAETMAAAEANHLIPPGDADALREAMWRVMNASENERHAAGAANAQRVREQFSLDVVLDRWEAVYHELGRRA